MNKFKKTTTLLSVAVLTFVAFTGEASADLRMPVCGKIETIETDQKSKLLEEQGLGDKDVVITLRKHPRYEGSGEPTQFRFIAARGNPDLQLLASTMGPKHTQVCFRKVSRVGSEGESRRGLAFYQYQSIKIEHWQPFLEHRNENR